MKYGIQITACDGSSVDMQRDYEECVRILHEAWLFKFDKKPVSEHKVWHSVHSYVADGGSKVSIMAYPDEMTEEDANKIDEAFDDRECDMASEEQLALLAKYGI